MFRTRIVLGLVVLLAVTGMAMTQDATSGPEKELGVTFDLTYMSKYVSYGVEAFKQQGGLFETISLDLWGTGFGVAFGHQSATSSGYVDSQRFNYKVYYANKLFAGEAYQTNYKFSWLYKHYYGRARNKGNVQEWCFGFSWPKLLPWGVVPKYTAVYAYPAGSNYNNASSTVWNHIFGLAYGLRVSQLPNPINLSADMTFKDGGSGRDHDWSHVTLGTSTKLAITDNLSFVPGLFHQITMDKSTSRRKDITYCKLSMKYKF